MNAVELLTTDHTVTADGTRANSLPTLQGKHRDLITVSSETVRSFLYLKFFYSCKFEMTEYMTEIASHLCRKILQLINLRAT